MELIVEGVVGVIGAASAISAYRGVKRRLRGQGQEDDLLTPTGALVGCTVLVTGANSGIGYAAAELLARKGATVMCACRDLAKAQHTADAINKRLDRVRQQQRRDGAQPIPFQSELTTSTVTTTATTIGRAEAAPAALDLGSLHSVRAFAEAYRGSGRPLSVLVNNAATMLPKREVVDAWGKGEEEEEEGAMRRPVERTMAVNHLGPWLLTTLLLPTLKDTGMREGSSARVIFVSSRLERTRGSARFLDAWLEDPAMEETHSPSSKPIYSAFSAYGASKLANLLNVQHLDRQRLGWTLTHPQPSQHATTEAITPAPSSEGDAGLLSQQPWDPSNQHVCAYGCTPGMVHTRLNRWAPWALRALSLPFSWALLQTPREGARPIVFLATSKRVEGRGGGFWAKSPDKEQPYEVVEVESSPESQDAVLAHRLWTLSEELAAPFLGPMEEKEQPEEGK